MRVHFRDSAEGDWEALYIDGRKMAEGHSIPRWELLACLDIKYTEEEVELDDVGMGEFPEELSL